MKSQKNNLRRLNTLGKAIDLNDFYSVTFTNTGIVLQGYFKKEVAKTAVYLRFKPEISKNGYLEFNRGLYTIVLT